MLSEKRIRAIVKDELKEQIRKQTIRMRVLASCNRVAERFGNPTGDSYYSKSEEIKEAIDKELKYVGKVYGIEITGASTWKETIGSIQTILGTMI